MRKYIINSVMGNQQDEFNSNIKQKEIFHIFILPRIGQYYEIGDFSLRCIEHKRGMAVLKADDLVVKLLEVN